VGVQRTHGKLTRHDAARAAEGALASLSSQQDATLLGWFVCRSGTQLTASAREQVCGGSDCLCPDCSQHANSERSIKIGMRTVI